MPRRALLYLLVLAFVLAVTDLALSSSTAQLILAVTTAVLLGLSALVELRERRRSRRER